MSNKVRPIHTSRIPWDSKMETIGDTFKKERIKLKKNLSTISLDTRIDVKKLKALESNNFSVFESPVSIKGFIKIYAEHLNLNSEKILAIYRRDFGEKVEIKQIVKDSNNKNPIFPKVSLFLIPLIFLSIILIYLYNQFSYFQNPPNLEIFEPENNTITNNEMLNIKGRSDPNATVEIGNLKISVPENGEFATKVTMRPGDNIITIRSTNPRNPSQETVKILNIKYEEIQEVEEEIERVENINLKLTIENAPTWIEIILDDQLIISQILDLGYSEEFTAKKNITVVTGIRENTRAEINDNLQIFSSDTFSVRCEIAEGELVCK